MRVLLGPSHELHSGIHGALTDRPAEGIEYIDGRYTHFFRYQPSSQRPFSPVRDHSESEWIRFENAQDVDLIHSARFPVETALPWVVDADCLLLPLQIGAFFAMGLSRGASAPEPGTVFRREAAMLARYADGGCCRILLRTERARRQFLLQISEHPELGGNIADALARKTEVVYPAVAASTRPGPRQSRPSIMFMGRTFVDKGGVVALAVFQRLREHLGSAFDATIVSSCPPDVTDRCKALHIDIQPPSDRRRYLERLANADIFFSPTLFESFGMGLVEAAAANTAIVTSSGPGMEHIDELFEDGQDAFLVSNALAPEARIRAYADALTTLITDGEVRHRLAANALALASTGILSLSRHNQTIERIYDNAVHVPLTRNEATARPKERCDDGRLRILGWSEQTCHWTRQRLIPPGGLRICL
ncbi:D-inositol-3-phosphate glycosyltransferase [compost metagenome]